MSLLRCDRCGFIGAPSDFPVVNECWSCPKCRDDESSIEVNLPVDRGNRVDYDAGMMNRANPKQGHIGYEAFCTHCGELFNPDGEDDLTHEIKIDGTYCGGLGEMRGWWD